ncbi:hypothetical protein Hamer_G004773 [Homarus americanus]|uniref:Uncharacterized protein n=1 Tax=Homarus americanus TaxID=6706 RepID=A0A8J5K4Y6_HOMAM|nr:hypothetical protein Hamer_G004773 [Homarus americanus]
MSSFARHSKKIAWTIWNVLPELTDVLLKLSSAPHDIIEDTMHTIERFFILLYDRTSICKDIDKARKKLFMKKSNVQPIHLTKAALEEHVKRASTRKDMCGAIYCYQHQSYLHQPAGVEPKIRKDCMSSTG